MRSPLSAFYLILESELQPVPQFKTSKKVLSAPVVCQFPYLT